MKHELITILGPTASGKTGLAAALAGDIGAEIISADSRQVYRGMDLGTGKDLDDYMVNGKHIPYHLIDIAEPGEEYNVYRFQQDFYAAFKDVTSRDKKAILCGGTGMYLESVILAYEMKKIPPNKKLRVELEPFDKEELIERLKKLRDVHNTTDTEDRNRLLRAIEISEVRDSKSDIRSGLEEIQHYVFGVSLPREVV
ncbi:MAG: isopentenyl transferase family protein, partial [Bacteroidota bacterium]